jgi:hypothetical protein
VNKPQFPFDSNNNQQTLDEIDAEIDASNKIVYRCIAVAAVIAVIAIVLTLSGCTRSEGKTRADKEAELDRTIQEINGNTRYLKVEKVGPGTVRSAPSTHRSGPSIADGRNDCTDLGNGQIHCPPTGGQR